ncbi:hypothetical protein HPP92_021132 [Vanilla planifolia]|uniref:Uncharacterized protein n=1 Tax=Vanilla planifolia TaxID=51239 RepID=A0A835PV15_VANPL|nr:hypothetical protein HPP92_021132 [Vanilla planifolia]
MVIWACTSCETFKGCFFHSVHPNLLEMTSAYQYCEEKYRTREVPFSCSSRELMGLEDVFFLGGDNQEEYALVDWLGQVCSIINDPWIDVPTKCSTYINRVQNTIDARNLLKPDGKWYIYLLHVPTLQSCFGTSLICPRLITRNKTFSYSNQWRVIHASCFCIQGLHQCSC